MPAITKLTPRQRLLAAIAIARTERDGKPVRMAMLPDDHIGFHRRIAANPEDQGPKLVYADYLSDNGFPALAETWRRMAAAKHLGLARWRDYSGGHNETRHNGYSLSHLFSEVPGIDPTNPMSWMRFGPNVLEHFGDWNPNGYPRATIGFVNNRPGEPKIASVDLYATKQIHPAENTSVGMAEAAYILGMSGQVEDIHTGTFYTPDMDLIRRLYAESTGSRKGYAKDEYARQFESKLNDTSSHLSRDSQPVRCSRDEIEAIHRYVSENPHDRARWNALADALHEHGKPALAAAISDLAASGRQRGWMFADEPDTVALMEKPSSYTYRFRWGDHQTSGSTAGLNTSLRRAEDGGPWLLHIDRDSGHDKLPLGRIVVEPEHGARIIHEMDETHGQVPYYQDVEDLRPQPPPYHPEQMRRSGVVTKLSREHILPTFEYVKANPHDDQGWLGLADLLSENGRPHAAELMRGFGKAEMKSSRLIQHPWRHMTAPVSFETDTSERIPSASGTILGIPFVSHTNRSGTRSWVFIPHKKQIDPLGDWKDDAGVAYIGIDHARKLISEFDPEPQKLSLGDRFRHAIRMARGNSAVHMANPPQGYHENIHEILKRIAWNPHVKDHWHNLQWFFRKEGQTTAADNIFHNIVTSGRHSVGAAGYESGKSRFADAIVNKATEIYGHAPLVDHITGELHPNQTAHDVLPHPDSEPSWRWERARYESGHQPIRRGLQGIATTPKPRPPQLPKVADPYEEVFKVTGGNRFGDWFRKLLPATEVKAIPTGKLVSSGGPPLPKPKVPSLPKPRVSLGPKIGAMIGGIAGTGEKLAATGEKLAANVGKAAIVSATMLSRQEEVIRLANQNDNQALIQQILRHPGAKKFGLTQQILSQMSPDSVQQMASQLGVAASAPATPQQPPMALPVAKFAPGSLDEMMHRAKSIAEWAASRSQPAAPRLSVTRPKPPVTVQPHRVVQRGGQWLMEARHAPPQTGPLPVAQAIPTGKLVSVGGKPLPRPPAATFNIMRHGDLHLMEAHHAPGLSPSPVHGLPVARPATGSLRSRFQRAIVMSRQPVRMAASDDPGLLRAIADNPWDMGRHQILADSLSDQGSPFGDLIRDHATGKRENQFNTWISTGHPLDYHGVRQTTSDDDGGLWHIGPHGPFNIFAQETGMGGAPHAPVSVYLASQDHRRPLFHYEMEFLPRELHALASELGGKVGENLREVGRFQWPGNNPYHPEYISYDQHQDPNFKPGASRILQEYEGHEGGPGTSHMSAHDGPSGEIRMSPEQRFQLRPGWASESDYATQIQSGAMRHMIAHSEQTGQPVIFEYLPNRGQRQRMAEWLRHHGFRPNAGRRIDTRYSSTTIPTWIRWPDSGGGG